MILTLPLRRRNPIAAAAAGLFGDQCRIWVGVFLALPLQVGWIWSRDPIAEMFTAALVDDSLRFIGAADAFALRCWKPKSCTRINRPASPAAVCNFDFAHLINRSSTYSSISLVGDSLFYRGLNRHLTAC